MNEQHVKSMIRDFLKAWTSGDFEKPLSLLHEDCIWVSPQGTFKGIEQIEKYLRWVLDINQGFAVTETGLGILVQGDIGVIEHELSGTFNGEKWVLPSVCIWEFKDGKISALRTFNDVLGQAHQVAKGPVEKLAVNSILKASRAGLE